MELEWGKLIGKIKHLKNKLKFFEPFDWNGWYELVLSGMKHFACKQWEICLFY